MVYDLVRYPVIVLPQESCKSLVYGRWNKSRTSVLVYVGDSLGGDMTVYVVFNFRGTRVITENKHFRCATGPFWVL